ncbi:MAG: type 4a pilus biogenesis protein PilO [Myxococcales bacterium]|nr:type 4a pilus biogenesis protein PilO [Myxococcales bacterium]
MAPPSKKQAAAAQPSIAEQLTPPVMIAIGVFFAIAVGATYYLAGYQPVQESIERERRRQTELDQQQRNANRDLSAYNDDVAELERLRSFAREQQRVLPDNPDIPGFLDAIHRTATENGLTIKLVLPEAEVIDQYFVRIPVRVEVNGGYLEIARFFRTIGSIPRVINMENIGLSMPVLAPDGKVRVDARMQATTFRALTPAEQTQQQEAAQQAAQQPNGARPQGGAAGRGGR